MKDPRGSAWRKWDLHIHSRYSCEPRTKLYPKDIFEAASANNIAVISITDHSNVDGLDEAWDVWENGTDANGNKFSEIIIFFPGVELKANAGKKGVHFLAILPPDTIAKGYEQKIDKNFFKESILSKIECSESDIKECGKGDYRKGLFEVAVDLKKTAELVRSLGGVIIVHNGRKDHSFDGEIAHPAKTPSACELLNTLGNHKEKLMRECVDICEFPNWNEYHQGEQEFYLTTFNKPSVVFSDSHESYNNTCPTWIKADPTFEGLKQVLNEPNDRICIGSPPDILDHIERNKPYYIRSVSITPSGTAPGWFNDTVPLNPGLVAIIGNKGTGKSALADIISLLGNTRQAEKFSFLQSRKFRDKKTGKAAHFQAKMVWLDGATSGPVTLDKDPQAGSVEKAKYLPQNFIEDVCTDLSASQDSLFYQELQGVIFSHLQDHERLGCASLAELLDQESAETEQQIEVKVSRLTKINHEIARLQENLSADVRSELEAKLDEKIRIVRQILKDKPLRKNTSDEVGKGQGQKEIVAEISVLQKREAQLIRLKDQHEKQRLEVNRKIAKANKLLEQLVWVAEKIAEFHESIAELAEPIGLDAEKIFQTRIDKGIVQSRKEQLLADRQSLGNLLGKEIEFSIEWELSPLRSKIQLLKEELSKPEKEYQDYLRKRKIRQERVRTEFGDRTEPQMGTIRKLRQELAFLAKIPQLIEDHKQGRLALAREIFQLKIILKEKFRRYHQPVQQFISEHPIAKDEKFPLTFTVSIAEEDFAKIFFEYISQGVNGSFCGTEQGQKRLNDILDRADFDHGERTMAFLEEILDELQEDKRDGQVAPVSIGKQLKKNSSEAELLNMLFSLSYLKPVYNLQWDGKGVDQLSPGERGQLLLIFYLLIDQATMPLIIDQPEENLDNQTVYQVLVPCIKKAKGKRQVILVTHNPNLAVVCDAEQIVCVMMDKKHDNRITYLTGAIENPAINRKIVEILEGTEPAFTIRESKYQFAGK